MNAERKGEFLLRWAEKIWVFMEGDPPNTEEERHTVKLLADEFEPMLDEYDYTAKRLM